MPVDIYKSSRKAMIEAFPQYSDMGDVIDIVDSLAHKYANGSCCYEDLFQTGIEAVFIADKKYDADRARRVRDELIGKIEDSSRDGRISADALAKALQTAEMYGPASAAMKRMQARADKAGFLPLDYAISKIEKNVKPAAFKSVAFLWIRCTMLNTIKKELKTVPIDILFEIINKSDCDECDDMYMREMYSQSGLEDEMSYEETCAMFSAINASY